jgi:hypothetical protein
MCDFSLHAVRSRLAKVGDKLTTHNFNWATTGFCAPEDQGMAVCLLPGTEVSFTEQVRRSATWPWTRTEISCKTAIFRQINKDKPNTHHDALEFPMPDRSSDKPSRRAASHGPSITSGGRKP